MEFTVLLSGLVFWVGALHRVDLIVPFHLGQNFLRKITMSMPRSMSSSLTLWYFSLFRFILYNTQKMNEREREARKLFPTIKPGQAIPSPFTVHTSYSTPSSERDTIEYPMSHLHFLDIHASY